MPAVARGSELLKDAPDKAATLLLDFPAAPYTAFLVDVAGCAECFQQHCLRLAEGLHLLSSAEQLKSQTSEVDWGGDSMTAFDIKQKAIPAIQLAVSACMTQQQRATPVMVTLVIDNRCKQDNWLLAHAASLPTQNTSTSVEVVCAAPPRLQPSVKHTQWIHARQQYTKHLPVQAGEGIICSLDGHLLEGFISNLFIVEHRADAVVVKTAVQNVLPGIVQQQVLHACQILGIQLECTGAEQDDRGQWAEAFLSNAVRGLRPISKISCLPDNPFGWDPWSCSFTVLPETSICAKLRLYLESTRDNTNLLAA